MNSKILVFGLGLLGGAAALAQGEREQPSSSAAIVAATNSMDVLDDVRPLGTGDTVNFRIVEDGDAPINLEVTDSGELEVPMVGRIKAAGRTSKAVAQEIKQVLEKQYYHRATVIVGIDRINVKAIGRIYLTGQVITQGPIELPHDEDLTVSTAILRAGGFADFANRRRVRLIRRDGGKAERIIVDVKSVLEEGRLENDVVLRPGDLIVVPERMINF